MSGCHTHGDQIGGYVLGALEPAEQAEMRLHLASCQRCARAEQELAGLPLLLDCIDPEDIPPPELSPQIEDAVLDRFVRERASTGRTGVDRLRPRVLIAAAGIAAAVLAALVVLLGGDDDARAYASADLRGRGPGSARAQVTAVPAGTQIELSARRLPARPGGVYEVWCVASDGRWVSGGTFRVQGDGRARAELTAAVQPGDYHRIVITRGARDAAEGRRGDALLEGRLVY